MGVAHRPLGAAEAAGRTSVVAVVVAEVVATQASTRVTPAAVVALAQTPAAAVEMPVTGAAVGMPAA